MPIKPGTEKLKKREEKPGIHNFHIVGRKFNISS